MRRIKGFGYCSEYNVVDEGCYRRAEEISGNDTEAQLGGCTRRRRYKD